MASLMPKPILSFLAPLICLVAVCAGAQPDAAPVSIAGSGAEEAYNLGLVVSKMESHIAAGDMPSLLKYFFVSMKAHQFLVSHPDLALPEKRDEVRPTLTQLLGRLNAVRSAAMNRNLANATAAVKELRGAWTQVKVLYPPEFLNAVSALSTRIYCPKHPDITGAEGDRCSKCGRTLQRMDEFCGLPSSNPIVRASLPALPRLVPGHETPVALKLLRKDGLPLREMDLLRTHTQRMHLFAIDSTLSDYHHAHPQPGTNAGEYVFSFTPKNSGDYRFWLDLLPVATRQEEMPSLDLGGFRPLPFDRTVTDTFTNASWRLKLQMDNGPLRAGFPGFARLIVTDLDGVPCSRLEPIMANFAHFAGFHEDGRTVYHLHAAGLKDILDPAARSGPEVELYLPGLKAGFVRLFAQIQIDGQLITAPFGISVEP